MSLSLFLKSLSGRVGVQLAWGEVQPEVTRPTGMWGLVFLHSTPRCLRIEDSLGLWAQLSLSAQTADFQAAHCVCVYVGGGGGTDVENSPVSLNAVQLPVRVWRRSQPSRRRGWSWHQGCACSLFCPLSSLGGSACLHLTLPPATDHIFLPGNPSTDLSRRTHSCATWHGPHGLRGRVPPRRAEMKLM